MLFTCHYISQEAHNVSLHLIAMWIFITGFRWGKPDANIVILVFPLVTHKSPVGWYLATLQMFCSPSTFHMLVLALTGNLFFSFFFFFSVRTFKMVPNSLLLLHVLAGIPWQGRAFCLAGPAELLLTAVLTSKTVGRFISSQPLKS